MREAEPEPTAGPAAQPGRGQPDEQPEPVTEWESEGGTVLPPGLALTLRGPDGAGPNELDAALAELRAALPDGYRLERD